MPPVHGGRRLPCPSRAGQAHEQGFAARSRSQPVQLVQLIVPAGERDDVGRQLRGHGRRWLGSRREVVAQHDLVHRGQRGTGVGAQLVPQCPADPVVPGESGGRAAHGVERADQRRGGRLVERVILGQLGQPGDRRGRVAGADLGLGPRHDRGRVFLAQRAADAFDPVTAQTGQWLALPEVEARAQHVPVASTHRAAEAEQVDLVGADVQPIGTGFPREPRTTRFSGFEGTADPGDVSLQRPAGLLRREVAPHPVHQRVDVDSATGFEQQHRQHRLLARLADRGGAPGDGQPNRPQDMELHVKTPAGETRPRARRLQGNSRISSPQHFHNFPTGGGEHYPRSTEDGKSGRCLLEEGTEMSTPYPARRRVTTRRRAAVALVAVGSTVLASALVGLSSGPAVASSHREAPLISSDPPVDNTDVYAFVSPDRPDTVTLIANWFPFEEPNGGPNFYPWATDAHYDINIDNDGDAKADLTYRWDFRTDDRRGNATFLYNDDPVTSLDDPDLLFRQTYTLSLIDRQRPGVTTLTNSGRVAPSNVGPASMPNYGVLRDQAITAIPGGGQSFAGQADDPFFLDLRVFDLLYGGDLSEVGQDTVAGYNVNTIALQVPKSALALRGNPTRNPVIGVWSDTERYSITLRTPGTQQSIGSEVQVSRLGNPLVNEVVVPAGLKDRFNSLLPEQDRTMPALVNRVTNPEVPALIERIYGIPAPATPRNDLVEIFLTGITTKSGGQIDDTLDLNSQLNNADVDPARFAPSEQLRLNTSIPPTAQPNRLGVLGGDLQGFPNGRRLADDALDISVQALEGAAVSGIVPALAAGDRVNQNNEVPFGTVFPYVALPNNTAVNSSSSGSGAVPPFGWPNFPTMPALTGLVAVALIGSGVVLYRRQSRGNAWQGAPAPAA